MVVNLKIVQYKKSENKLKCRGNILSDNEYITYCRVRGKGNVWRIELLIRLGDKEIKNS